MNPKVILVFLVSFTFLQQTLAEKGKQGRNKNRHLGPSERKMITERFKSLSPDQVEQAKAKAVKSIEGNMVKMLRKLSSANSPAPKNVKADAKTMLKAAENGQLTGPLKSALPRFLMNSPRGNPTKQLNKLLGSLQETSKKGKGRMGSPVDGLMKFLRNDMAGTNDLVNKLMMGSPDLMSGALKPLMASMGHIDESVDGSMTNINELLGGLMG